MEVPCAVVRFAVQILFTDVVLRITTNLSKQQMAVKRELRPAAKKGARLIFLHWGDNAFML